MNDKVCILGCGITGYLILNNIFIQIKKNIAYKKLEIFIIEKTNILGPGYSYNINNKIMHLLNNKAEDVSLDYDNKYDFVDWIYINREKIKNNIYKNSIKSKELKEYYENFDKENIKNTYYPRYIYGIYCNDKFNNCINDLKKINIKITILIDTIAEDLIKNNNLYNIIIKNNNKVQTIENFNKVFICTGYFLKNNNNLILNNPYSIRYEEIIKKDIGILGTGLTSIDVILEIASLIGEFIKINKNEYKFIQKIPQKITCFSRKGRLPRIKGDYDRFYKPIYFTLENINEIIKKDNVLDKLVKLFEMEMKNISGLDININDIIKLKATNIKNYKKSITYIENNKDPMMTFTRCCFDELQHAIANIGILDKLNFINNYFSVFMGWISPIPSINGYKLLALMESNVLNIIKINENYKITIYNDNVIIINGSNEYSFNYLIDCTGRENVFINKEENTLLKNLFSKKLLTNFNINDKEKILNYGIKINFPKFDTINEYNNINNITYLGPYLQLHIIITLINIIKIYTKKIVEDYFNDI